MSLVRIELTHFFFLLCCFPAAYFFINFAQRSLQYWSQVLNQPHTPVQLASVCQILVMIVGWCHLIIPILILSTNVECLFQSGLNHQQILSSVIPCLQPLCFGWWNFQLLCCGVSIIRASIHLQSVEKFYLLSHKTFSLTKLIVFTKPV